MTVLDENSSFGAMPGNVDDRLSRTSRSTPGYDGEARGVGNKNSLVLSSYVASNCPAETSKFIILYAKNIVVTRMKFGKRQRASNQ